MTRYWQDLEVGETFSTSDSLTLEREDILEFAAEFDPQPYHLDREAAEASIFGGLCASGWRTTRSGSERSGAVSAETASPEVNVVRC